MGNFMSHMIWPERFSKKVCIRSSDMCWPWTAVKIPGGYGQFWYNGKMINAHRAALMFSGITIPEGYVVMHSCDNKDCCNPKHLKAVKQITNIEDAVAKDRHCRGDNHGMSVLTEKQVLYILQRRENATKAALKFGVSKATIYDIRQGRSWLYLQRK